MRDAPALALLVLGAIAITTIGQLGAHSEKILKDNYRTVLATQRMKEAIERMDSAALFIALGSGNPGLRGLDHQDYPALVSLDPDRPAHQRR